MTHWQGWLYVAAVLIPLAAFAVEFVAGRALGRLNAWIATAAIFASFVLSAIGLASWVATHPGLLTADPHHEAAAHAAAEPEARGPEAWAGGFDWVRLGGGLDAPGGARTGDLVIPLGIRIDGLAALMFAMVTFIATLIHIYSTAYMSGDPGYHRFFSYLSLFCFSMLGLVASPTIFQVFAFWELVGVCSYLLIGFWYEDTPNTNAANKAFIVNRVGDIGMLVGLGVLWGALGTFDIHEINRTLRGADGALHVVETGDGALSAELRDPESWQTVVNPVTDAPRRIPLWLLSVAGLGVFAGCVGKSAQFPLHVWLPDAMAGPTPVSALIHAATMVAAGVYLVGRFYPVFTPLVLLYIAYTGAITLFLAATIAVVQTDYKKVLAYSTVSQLGFMMLGLGVGGWAAGLFHLITHAFFKALLFLGAGSVYHAVHTYDLTRLGGLRRKLPVTSLTMLLATLAISGVPFFSGFYSKDAVLAAAVSFVGRPGNGKHALLLVVPAVGAALTAFYMFRMWILLFRGESRSAHLAASGHGDHGHGHGDPVAHAHEGPPAMRWPLILLAIPTVVAGYPWFVAPLAGTPVLERALSWTEPYPIPIAHWAHGVAFLISLVVAGGGIALALAFYEWRTFSAAEAARRLKPLHTFLVNKWYFDELYRAVFVRPTLALARGVAGLDRHVLDGVVNGAAGLTAALSRLGGRFDRVAVDGAVNALGRAVYALGDWGRLLQTGRLRQYLTMLALALAALSFGVFRWVGG
jgi:proton-translocating NADH-quinone oxidoreductase chain L